MQGPEALSCERHTPPAQVTTKSFKHFTAVSEETLLQLSVSGVGACGWGKVVGFWASASSAWHCSLFLFLAFCCAGVDLAASRMARAPSCTAPGSPLVQAQAPPTTCASSIVASRQSSQCLLKTHTDGFAKSCSAHCVPTQGAGCIILTIPTCIHMWNGRGIYTCRDGSGPELRATFKLSSSRSTVVLLQSGSLQVSIDSARPLDSSMPKSC